MPVPAGLSRFPDSITLGRGGRCVDSFLSCFGDLKETRLTAALGYLLANGPDAFRLQLLGSGEPLRRISIEEHEDGEVGRPDLRLEGTRTVTLVEAKLGGSQRPSQLERYLRGLRRELRGGGFTRGRLILVDGGSEAFPLHGHHGKRIQVRQLSWNRISSACRSLARRKRFQKDCPLVASLMGDFATHLEEVGMVQHVEKEIYSRDMSGPSLDLFFRRHIYKCQPKFYELASKCQYFAPYFSKPASGDFGEYSVVRIHPGISYVAKIIDHGRVPRREVLPFLKRHRWPRAAEAARAVVAGHGLKVVTVLLLDEPQRLFFTPVTKRQLAIGGSMGARPFTLHELLLAANGGDLKALRKWRENRDGA